MAKEKNIKKHTRVAAREPVDLFEHARKNLSPAVLAKAKEYAVEYTNAYRLAQSLKNFRVTVGRRQGDVPGFSQAGVSQVESRNDIHFSTMLRYIGGFNYDLVLLAVPQDRSKSAYVLEGKDVVDVRDRALVLRSPVEILGERSKNRPTRTTSKGRVTLRKGRKPNRKPIGRLA